jgi:meso-butanediol dehydrogenase/(S,S)-butanediol dehydrogenase/diacetyl reductase
VRLEDKVAVISGGGTGIGAATATLFASEGAKVVVTGRREEPLHAVAEATGGLAVAGDVVDPAHAGAVVAAAIDAFGRLDIVVANAGVGLGGSAADVTDDDWRTTLDVNLTGAMRLVRAAMPALTEAKGAIVLVSSISGFVASSSSVAYVASKAGLIGLTKAIAVDSGPLGVRANALCPGWVRTQMGDDAMADLARGYGGTLDEAYARATSLVPLRRAAEPSEVAACALFLASDAASYVHGTTLLVDGGGMAVDVASVAFDDGWEGAS